MKILFFTNSLAGGGAERAAATLANHWARLGWQVTVVTLAPAVEDFYLLDPQVRRIALDLAGASDGVLDALRQNLRRVAVLRRVLAELRPAVAVALMSTPNVLLALAAWGRADICTIGSERCFPPHFPLGRAWSALRRRGYGRLDAVVAQTSECAAWLGAHSNAERVAVIPNAVSWPLPRHAPRVAPEAVCGRDRKILLAVGRFEQVKNFGALIGAFAAIAQRNPAWDLVILGEGPQRPRLEQAVRDAGLEARIRLPGIAGNVGDWYAGADLYAMSSESEGFPNTLAEALAHGLPAVSFDCDTGPRDIIRHGLDGLLVPPGDLEGLGRALERLMSDAALRACFAQRAPEARERFSTARVARMWEDLFHDLRAARPLPGARAPVPPEGGHA